MEIYLIDNKRLPWPGISGCPQQAVTMVPGRQKERQPGTLVNKINFVGGTSLVDDLTDPILPKQKKIKSDVHHVTRQATIETKNPDRRKRWVEVFE
ncbi:hypothetical protein GCM10028773_10010 [Spirosoma koreense]